MTRRVDIMRRELRRIVLEAAPGLEDCVWEPYQGPRPARPYASWRPIVQPSIGARLRDDALTTELVRQAQVQVMQVTIGQPYKLRWNYTGATSTPEAGATLTTIRDDLLAKVNADRDPVTATALDGDKLILEGDTPGDLWRVLASGEFLEASPVGGSPIDIVELTRAPLKLTASLNVFSAGVSSEGGSLPAESSSYAHSIDVAFRKQRVVESLHDWNLSIVRIAEPVNLDGLPPSQTAYESRTAMDYRIELPYWDSDFVEEIGSVEVEISTDKGSTSFTV